MISSPRVLYGVAGFTAKSCGSDATIETGRKSRSVSNGREMPFTDSASSALKAAIESDPLSAFGGIIGANREFDDEAARLIGGNVEDREKFMAAFRKVEIPDAPRGPVKLDAWGNPIQNIYVRKVERKGGDLQNTVIHTFPAVSQFWKYKAEDFLKQPVYDRNFPACKSC